MVVLVQAALASHHIWSEIGESLNVVLPFGLTGGIASVLHRCVWRACLGLTQSNLATARENVRARLAKASSEAHILLLVHHGGVTARDANCWFLDTR